MSLVNKLSEMNTLRKIPVGTVSRLILQFKWINVPIKFKFQFLKTIVRPRSYSSNPPLTKLTEDELVMKETGNLCLILKLSTFKATFNFIISIEI